VLALVTACFADVSPSADTCGDASCEEHVSAELLQMNAADTAVQLLQRRASESLDATADTVEDNEDESDEESDAQSEDDGASTCKKKCQKQFTKWVKKGKEGAGVKRICAKSFCKDCSFCQQECKKKCSKKYNKFVKKGKWANNFKKVCGKDICKGCSFCEEEPPTPTPTAPCRDSCQSTYDKFVKKGKEGLGHQKVCEKSSCSGCSFCEEEFPTPAPTAPCQDSCQNTYDKFVKKGKEGLGHKKVCAKSSCSGCSFCEEEFPTPAPTGPCQDKCQDVYDKFAKKGKASEGKEAVCAKYSCSGCEMCTDDDWVPPTAEPTAEPTESPTEQPTAEPTLEPTAEPTEEPTDKPTAEPTPKPTEEPAPDPTPAPTTEEEDYECSDISNQKDCEDNDCAWDKDVSTCDDPDNEDTYRFEGQLGSRNGAESGLYKFRAIIPKDLNGNYDDIMVKACEQVRMKPMCDHPSYCKTDRKSLYVGQDHHTSYPPHLNADSYWPSGWNEIKNKFPKDFCTYTGASGGRHQTLCTNGGSHAWKTASNQFIICVAEPEYIPDAPFKGWLEGQNGANSGNYTFRRIRAEATSGNYDDIMVEKCNKVRMKPLCDHPSYCKTDPKVVYIGQTGHISHKGHRDTNQYFPNGWNELKSAFPDNFCTYTGQHGSHQNTLCTSGGGHAWQNVNTNREIMCASEPPYVEDDPFEGELGEKNGIDKGVYKFQRIRTKETGGNYDDLMIAECAKVDMKPLCDHPSYCRNDANSVYIGQSYHIAYLPHLNQDSYFPSGWNELKQKFPSHFCTYTASSGGREKTLCTVGTSHGWQAAGRGYQDIMCARAPEYDQDDPFQGQLGSRKGSDAGLYKFQRVRAQVTSGNYDTIMVNECAKQGMKPICDHASYCKGDARSVYVGHDGHLSHPSHRSTISYFPSGWAEINPQFPSTYCTFTGPHGGQQRTLCTRGGSHEWNTVTQNKEIMCVKPPPYKRDLPFSGVLGSKGGNNAGLYKFQRVRTFAQSGDYDDVMVAECEKVGMKPLCDHPSYCKNDPKAEYIGQSNHIAHTPYRNNNAYFPAGWNELKSKFPDKFCAYTAHHGSSAKSLCTEGGSHNWQPVTGNREIMCVKAPPYKPDDPFKGQLDSKNEANSGTYTFQRLRVQATSGNYDTIMVNECDKNGMKPLCDHPSYCRNDPKTVYIGQDSHISHHSYLNNDNYFPKGWSDVKGKFPTSFCTYTGNSGGAHQTLCTTGGGHSWQTVTGNREIMCAKAPPYQPDPPFSGILGSRNGADAGEYKFQKVRIEATSGNYDVVMINECGKKGMKPLCDHPSYCKTDLRAVYIGQDNHMAYPPHRNQDSYFGSGWSELKQKFPQEFCAFTGPHGGTSVTLCTNGGSHGWYNINTKRFIMCAKAPPYKPDDPFEGELGDKNGIDAGVYKFQRIRIQTTSGNYDTIMVNECSKLGMKPLCDHPSYCKADIRAIYIGQSNHISYGPHRNQDSYFPQGWSNIKGKFPSDFCTFTGPHGSTAKTLCTHGSSHAWRTPNENREIMCAKAPPYKPDPPFTGELGSRNGANAGKYTFQRVRIQQTSGNYDAIMVNECGKKGMKPLCDHPSYCKNDPKAAYLGQDNHLAYPPHRNQASYFPSGWEDLKSKFPATFCTYTGPHGGTAKTLCTYGSSHQWQTPSENREIMCVKAPPYEPEPPFSGVLDSKNGQNAGKYTFQKVRIEATSGNYDVVMINECDKKGMRPLCDHPSYCRNDPKAGYIGQQAHMAYPPHLNQMSYFPKGWEDLKDKFRTQFCAYTGGHGGAHQTLCVHGNSHQWNTITGQRDIMCVKTPPYIPDDPFEGHLEGQNSADTGVYKFQRLRVQTVSGNYDTIFVNECAKRGMKPLCDHPSYCKSDPRATYIGQTNHISYGPHRNQDSYFPKGWSDLKGKFPSDFCTFTGPHGGTAKSLCTHGSSHAWRTATENPEIMCVKAPPYKPDPPFAGTLGSKNAANAGKYTFQRIRITQSSGNIDDIMVSECAKKKNEAIV
jgi:hypothetical protein